MSTAFETHIMSGVIPVADAFAGTVATDILEMQGEGIMFVRYDGAGAVGTSTVTVLACDDTTPTNSTAVPFKYRISTTPDTWGAWTEATDAGFTTTAGASQIYQIWAAAEEQAYLGYKYVKCVFVESADDPVTGAVLAILFGGRYKEAPESYID
jgi:hypothetical protein